MYLDYRFLSFLLSEEAFVQAHVIDTKAQEEV